jgi:hypothetical protein
MVRPGDLGVGSVQIFVFSKPFRTWPSRQLLIPRIEDVGPLALLGLLMFHYVKVSQSEVTPCRIEVHVTCGIELRVLWHFQYEPKTTGDGMIWDLFFERGGRSASYCKTRQGQ